MAKEAKGADEGSPAPRNKGKKLLIIIILALLLILVGGALGVGLYMSNHGADEDEEYAEEPVKPKKAAARPVFVNLEPFIVNLAPETGDQYLQVGLSLEVEDSATDATLKALMPRIRNDITLLLSSKKASELVTKEGKEQLARALKDEINLAILPQTRGKTPVHGPIQAVLFTSFIIQ